MSLQPKCIFLIGLNDSKTIAVSGYDRNGQLSYSWGGNTDFYNYVETRENYKKIYSIIWSQLDYRTLGKPDVFINCIANPDVMTHSIARACEMLDIIHKRWPDVYVFNHPSLLAETTRDRIYERFKDMPGLDMPMTLRFSPAGVDDIIDRVRKSDLRYPLIVRPCGAHQGNKTLFLENPNKRQLLEQFAYDGTDYYFTEFRDCKDADGFYSKARFVMIGGEVYPRHLLFGQTWMVHGDARETLMYKEKKLRRREEDFMENHMEMVSPDALASMRAIYRELQLDYLGFDCAILPDGRLLIFEINVSQNCMSPSDYGLYPYLRPHVDAIVEGFNVALLQRAFVPGKAAAG